MWTFIFILIRYDWFPFTYCFVTCVLFSNVSVLLSVVIGDVDEDGGTVGMDGELESGVVGVVVNRVCGLLDFDEENGGL